MWSNKKAGHKRQVFAHGRALFSNEGAFFGSEGFLWYTLNKYADVAGNGETFIPGFKLLWQRVKAKHSPAVYLQFIGKELVKWL